MKLDEIGKINSYMVKNTLNTDKNKDTKVENTTPIKPIEKNIIGATPLRPLTGDVFIKEDKKDKKN